MLFFPQVGGEALGKAFPGQLAGLIAAFAGMIAGSLAPQKLRNRQEPRKTMAGLTRPVRMQGGPGLRSGAPAYN